MSIVRRFIRRSFGSAIYLICFLSFGCSSTKLQVPVTRPAAINLNGIDRIALRDFIGPGSERLSNELEEGILATGRFTIVDRSVLRDLIREYSLSSRGILDPISASRLGNAIGIAVLIDGKVDRHYYDEKIESKKVKGRKGRKHTQYTRTGTAYVSVGFRVVELETGKLLASKNIRKSTTQKEYGTNEDPDEIDSDLLLTNTRAAVIDEFLKTISPYTEYVKVSLLKNGDIPKLNQGIQYAKIGDWNSAIKLFESAVRNNPSSPEALFNLGTSYLYVNRFDDASRMFRRALQLKPSKEFREQLNIIERRRREFRKLREQS